MSTQIETQNNRPDVTKLNIAEKPTLAINGALNLILTILIVILGGVLIANTSFQNGLANVTLVILVLLLITFISTLHIIQPGESLVMSFFGQYVGTIRKTGLVASLPFLKAQKVSVRIANFETPVSKVNDANGNPINISAIVVWQLDDTAKATYAVEDYYAYLATQAEAAVRHVAAIHPYDSGNKTDEQEPRTPSLLGTPEIINNELLQEVTERTQAAGVRILEVRVNNLSYSVEIAQAMLQRQQANAVVEARKIIVQGAVGIVEDAVRELETNTSFADDAKSTLVSNLLIVLVGESKVTPTMDVSSGNKKRTV